MPRASRIDTPPELRAVVQRALAGMDARIVHTVTPLRSSQMIDITWD